MINNIVDMNKIEVGFFNLNLKNNNIIKVIEDITLSIVEYAKLKDITVVFDTEIEEKITAFDDGRLLCEYSASVMRVELPLMKNRLGRLTCYFFECP